MARMEPLPQDVAGRDHELRYMQRGDDLGALRYLWCVERETSYGTYANAVGVTRQAVWLAVRGHARRTGKPKRGRPLGNARTTPLCPDCGETDPKAFHRCKSRRSGRQTYCKTCASRRYSAGRAGRARAKRRHVDRV